MSKQFNNITLVGRIGKDNAELKDGKSAKYVQFSFVSDLGGIKENAIWFTCRIFRNIGKGVDKLTAGKKLLLTGELSIEPPTQDGKVYYSINVGTFGWLAEGSSEKKSTEPLQSDFDDFDDLPF